MQDFDYSHYVSAAYLISTIIFITFSAVTITKFIKKNLELKKITDEKQQ
jgi:hypothetical protein